MKLAVALILPLTALCPLVSGQMRPVGGAEVPDRILEPAAPASDGASSGSVDTLPSQPTSRRRPPATTNASRVPEAASSQDGERTIVPQEGSPAPSNGEMTVPQLRRGEGIVKPLSSGPGYWPLPPARDPEPVTLPAATRKVVSPLPGGQETAPSSQGEQTAEPPPLPNLKGHGRAKTRISDLPNPGPSEKPRFRPFTHYGLAVKADSLGLGGELATPLSQSLNLRAGVSLTNFGFGFGIDGVNYRMATHLKSGTATIDWFPRHGGFHISPGVLYMETSLGGTANVPMGRYFSLGDSSYLNSIDDPVAGTATFKYSRKVSPMLLMGFGNLLPRSGRHISVPFELGAAYTGQGVINVNLAGTACTSKSCFDVAKDPQTQSNLHQELTDLNNHLKPVPIYPIISLGLAFRF